MKARITALLCSLVIAALTCLCCAEDFGISRKAFGPNTVFTFRNGFLVHEITVFVDPKTKKRESWVERFYADNQPVFIRIGSDRLTSERYAGLSGAMVAQSSRLNGTYPQRLSVGRESFNMGEDGFYRIIEDPQEVLRESRVNIVEFSNRLLEEERKKHLNQANPHK